MDSYSLRWYDLPRRAERSLIHFCEGLDIAIASFRARLAAIWTGHLPHDGEGSSWAGDRVGRAVSAVVAYWTAVIAREGWVVGSVHLVNWVVCKSKCCLKNLYHHSDWNY